MGLVFLQLTDTQEGVQGKTGTFILALAQSLSACKKIYLPVAASRQLSCFTLLLAGALFFLIMNQVMASLMGVLQSFPVEKHIFNR